MQNRCRHFFELVTFIVRWRHLRFPDITNWQLMHNQLETLNQLCSRTPDGSLLMDPLPQGEEAAGVNDLWSDRSDLYPLHHAARCGCTERVRQLLHFGNGVNEVDWDQISPLHEACLHGHIECTKLLIESGALINVTNIDGSTPLCEASSKGSEECVQLLLNHGALVNPPLALSTPLHEAVVAGKVRCVQLLVEVGARLDASDCHFGTPLHTAAYAENSVCARILLRAGASVNATKTHRSALHIAAANPLAADVALQLLEFGANVYARDNQGRTPRELTAVDSPLYSILQYHECNPKTLQGACRWKIRSLLGPKRLRRIYELKLPKPLARFVDHK